MNVRVASAKRGSIRRPALRGTTLLLVAGAGLGLAGMAWSQLSRYVKAKDVKFPEFYETPAAIRGHTNRLKGLLTGAEGQYLSNEVFLIRQMRLEHYQPDGRTSLVARAPQCLFDSDSRVAWSTGRLEIAAMSGALLVAGQEGFELRMTNSTMTVSNRVRTTIRQELLKRARP